MTTHIYRRDSALYFYGIIAAAGLIVSSPATYNLAATFHADGTPLGIAATVALLVILEAGAIAAKLAKLTVHDADTVLEAYCIGALTVNGLANFITAVQLGTLHIQPGAGDYGKYALVYIGAALWGASVQILIYLMLYLFVHRVQALRGDADDVDMQVQRKMQPLIEVQQINQALHTAGFQIMAIPTQPYPRIAAPEQPVYAAPVQTERLHDAGMQPAPDAPTCMKCGAPVENNKVRASSKRWGCTACKEVK